MAARIRLGWIAGIFVAAGLATGCNLISLPFFLFGPEPSIPAKMKELGAKDKRDETTVVILTYAGPETRPEFIKVDRDLAARIADEMRTAFQANGPRKVAARAAPNAGGRRSRFTTTNTTAATTVDRAAP